MKRIVTSIITSMIILSGNVLHADLTEEAFAEDCCSECEVPVRGFSGYYGVAAGANFVHGLKWWSKSLNSWKGFVVSAHLGHRFSNGLRVESEFAFRKNYLGQKRFPYYFRYRSHFNGSFRSYSGMVNLLWEVRKYKWECFARKIQPYIGAGVGYDYSEEYGYGRRTRSFDLNWQVMAGVFHAFSDNIEISLDYKFHANEYWFNNSIGLGLKYFVGG
jgi:opacity protein-like surface antigen